MSKRSNDEDDVKSNTRQRILEELPGASLQNDSPGSTAYCMLNKDIPHLPEHIRGCHRIKNELSTLINSLKQKCPIEGLNTTLFYLNKFLESVAMFNQVEIQPYEYQPAAYINHLVKNIDMFVDQFQKVDRSDIVDEEESAWQRLINNNEFKEEFTNANSTVAKLKSTVNALKQTVPAVAGGLLVDTFDSALTEFIARLKEVIILSSKVLMNWNYVYMNGFFRKSTFAGSSIYVRSDLFFKCTNNKSELDTCKVYFHAILPEDALITRSDIKSLLDERCYVPVSLAGKLKNQKGTRVLRKVDAVDFNTVDKSQFGKVEVSDMDILYYLNNENHVLKNKNYNLVDVKDINTMNSSKAVFHVVTFNENTFSQLDSSINLLLQSNISDAPYIRLKTYLLIIVSRPMKEYDKANLEVFYNAYLRLLKRKGPYRGIYFMFAKKVEGRSIENVFPYTASDGPEKKNNKFRLQGIKHSLIYNHSLFFDDITYDDQMKLVKSEKDVEIYQSAIGKMLSRNRQSLYSLVSVAAIAAPVVVPTSSIVMKMGLTAISAGAQAYNVGRNIPYIPNAAMNTYSSVTTTARRFGSSIPILGRFISKNDLSRSSSSSDYHTVIDAQMAKETHSDFDYKQWPSKNLNVF